MSTAPNPYSAYRQNGIMTANPGELVVMLYDGCIKQVKLSEKHMLEKNWEKVNKHLQNAQDIIMGLIMGLDLQFSIARDLMALYEYMLESLTRANTNKDTSELTGILEMLTELRSAWDQARRISRIAAPELEY
ncbi:MAG: flagellar export chaperone FliS [Christensenellales bacterium]|jgi:flagellar protein FliS